jgi:sporadic carbohydrate cluster 2OG-Fe(II) oxygenase
MIKNSDLKKFHEQGFITLNIKNFEILKKIKKYLIQELKKNLKQNEIIKKYHTKYDDKEHYKLQYKVQNYIKKNQLHFEIIQNYKELFANFLGNDICVTNSINFRIIRPSIDYDNLNYHRDIDLGHTPYELNVWLPLFNTNIKNTLYLLPKSHVKKTDYFKSFKKNTKFKKRSLQNKLGYLYKSFEHKNFNERLMKPVKCKYGQILIFYSSCMHGTKSNNSKETRFSMDFNISNSFYPINWTHHTNERKYRKIVESKIALNARYLKS